MKIVEIKRGKVFCTSIMFSEKMEMNHRDVLKDIRNLTATANAVKDEFLESEYTNNRNRKYPMILITRRGFMFLIMNTNVTPGRKQILYKIQTEFVDAFEKMEQLLLTEQTNKNNIEWNRSREQGKQVRTNLTDAIKKFVDYAATQGSKSSNRYYSNITKMEYKALGLMQEKNPKLRNTLDMMELHQLILAEDLCRRMIAKYMSENLHYKEIYLLVKKDLGNFAGSLMLSK